MCVALGARQGHIFSQKLFILPPPPILKNHLLIQSTEGESTSKELVNSINLYYKNFTPFVAHSFVENIAKGASGDFDNKTSTENHVIKIKVPPLSVRPYLSISKYLTLNVSYIKVNDI